MPNVFNGGVLRQRGEKNLFNIHIKSRFIQIVNDIIIRVYVSVQAVSAL